MFTYETYQTEDGTFAFRIIKDENGEVYVDQPINPETGEPFTSKEEAENFAKQVMNEYNLQHLQENPPILEVSFLDDSGNSVRIIDVGQSVNVKVELYYPNADGTKTYAPVTGDYIVPYYFVDGDSPAGTVLIHLENGQGYGKVTFTKSGVFEIRLDKILNAETMKQPSPLPKLATNPKLAVVEPVEK